MATASNQAITAIADSFMAAIERGDVAAVKKVYSPHAKIWHNTDQVFQTVDENLVTLGGLIKGTKKRSYENRVVRTYRGPGNEVGFIQQHVLITEGHDGRQMRLPAVIICAVNDQGQITKLDEYFDQAPVDKWVAEAAAASAAKNKKASL